MNPQAAVRAGKPHVVQRVAVEVHGLARRAAHPVYERISQWSQYTLPGLLDEALARHERAVGFGRDFIIERLVLEAPGGSLQDLERHLTEAITARLAAELSWCASHAAEAQTPVARRSPLPPAQPTATARAFALGGTVLLEWLTTTWARGSDLRTSPSRAALQLEPWQTDLLGVVEFLLQGRRAWILQAGWSFNDAVAALLKTQHASVHSTLRTVLAVPRALVRWMLQASETSKSAFLHTLSPAVEYEVRALRTALAKLVTLAPAKWATRAPRLGASPQFADKELREAADAIELQRWSELLKTEADAGLPPLEATLRNWLAPLPGRRRSLLVALLAPEVGADAVLHSAVSSCLNGNTTENDADAPPTTPESFASLEAKPPRDNDRERPFEPAQPAPEPAQPPRAPEYGMRAVATPRTVEVVIRDSLRAFERWLQDNERSLDDPRFASLAARGLLIRTWCMQAATQAQLSELMHIQDPVAAWPGAPLRLAPWCEALRVVLQQRRATIGGTHPAPGLSVPETASDAPETHLEQTRSAAALAHRTPGAPEAQGSAHTSSPVTAEHSAEAALARNLAFETMHAHDSQGAREPRGERLISEASDRPPHAAMAKVRTVDRARVPSRAAARADREPLDEHRWQIAEWTGSYAVPQAGLVLLWPYLPEFFKLLGLLDGTRLPEARRAQAAQLLHFVASGERDAEESDLLLPKLLAGFPLEAPLPRRFELDEAAEREAPQLIEAVIENWGALGNTSVEGFRHSFLRRHGLLSLREDGPLLQVERTAYDLLLERLPWTLSMIKLSWMQQLLVVQW